MAHQFTIKIYVQYHPLCTMYIVHNMLKASCTWCDKLYICLSIITRDFLLSFRWCTVLYSVQCTQLIFVYPVHICADVLKYTVRCLFVNVSLYTQLYYKLISEDNLVHCTVCAVLYMLFCLFTTVYIFSVVFSRAGVEAPILQLHRKPKNE